MTENFDAIVIGAGHNGLVCATLLAKAGRDVLVLEARDEVGGAAATETFAEACSVSSGAHLLYGLQPAVQKALGLDIKLAADDVGTIALGEDGNHLRLRGDSIQGASDTDTEAWQDFRRRMLRYAALLRRQMNRPPPRLGSGRRADLVALGKLGFDIRRLGRRDMRDFLRVIGMNIFDEVEECFENPLLKGAVSLDAVLGTHLGPRSPNTILTYLHRLSANGGRLSIPAGGMGAVSRALAEAAENAGVTIRTGKTVSRILIENGRVAGVETAGGDEYGSLTVVSNADPKHTVMDLAGTRHVETAFARRVHNIRMRGNAAKLHLALDRLPEIPGLVERDLGERLVVAPDANYVERAFNPAKYGECSPEPVAEITFPSVKDASLAPSGRHVMSAVVQYAPYGLREGWNDDAGKAFTGNVMATLGRYMPDLEKRVVASQLLAPPDLEARFGMTGGHWHHGELTLDQFLFVRPVGGAAQYAMPLDGLWLCGAGAHPGGDVSGAPGRNAANAILAREKGA